MRKPAPAAGAQWVLREKQPQSGRSSGVLHLGFDRVRGRHVVFACLVIFKCANHLFKWIVIIVLFQYFDATDAYFCKRLLVGWAGSSVLRFSFFNERNGLV